MSKTKMNKVDVNAMGKDELRALCTRQLDELTQANEKLAELYHPEFGSEWTDEGQIGQAILSARIEALDGAIELITPPEGANGDVAAALTIAMRALTAKRAALLRRAIEAAEARKRRGMFVKLA